MTSNVQATDVATASSFVDFALAPFIQETIAKVGYTTPTPIQAGAIPTILEGKDVIGLAQTGTGKTAAFVLPLLQRLSGGAKGVRALILAPTRELAEQINGVIKTFSGRTGLRSVTIYGGVSHRGQLSQLAARPQIVVACPGRLMDHIRGRSIDLSGVEFLVLDEADRMFDMGFMPDVKAIVKELPSERQTLLFSATMPEEIASLSASILKNPVTIRVRAEQPVALVAHSMYSVKQDDKGEVIASWLRGNTGAVSVVFTKMKHTAKRLGDRLTKAGIPAVALHGNLSQGQRQRALQGFRDGKFRALIATDIASRGIDVEGVTHVVNYDMPDTLEAYIHRTGRAGRASREGQAVSFVTRADRDIIRSVEKWLKTPLTRLNIEGSDEAETSEETPSPRGARPRQDRRGARTQERPQRNFRRERDESREPSEARGPREGRESREYDRPRRDSARPERGAGRTWHRDGERRDGERRPRSSNRFGERAARGEGRESTGGERREWRGNDRSADQRGSRDFREGRNDRSSRGGDRRPERTSRSWSRDSGVNRERSGNRFGDSAPRDQRREEGTENRREWRGGERRERRPFGGNRSERDSGPRTGRGPRSTGRPGNGRGFSGSKPRGNRFSGGRSRAE